MLPAVPLPPLSSRMEYAHPGEGTATQNKEYYILIIIALSLISPVTGLFTLFISHFLQAQTFQQAYW